MGQKTTLKDFLERSRLVHGNRYDYSKVDYKTTESKVVIICDLHGEFLMRPRAHYTDNRGCPDCDTSGKSGFHKSTWVTEPKNLYVIELFGKGERFINFGVTVNSTSQRISKGQIPYSNKILLEKKNMNGEQALKTKEKLELKFANDTYKPKLHFKGHTDCLEYGNKEQILKYLKEM